jgi:hypothetical protein
VTDEPLSPIEEEQAAIKRIGATYDGSLLYRHLRRILEGCRVTEDSGALQRHEGGRIFARELLAQMAEGIASGRRADTEPLAPARTSGAVAVARPRGIARRVAAASPEPDADT